MKDDSISFNSLKTYLVQCGASAVGFADLSDLDGLPDGEFTHAVSIALALPSETIIHLQQCGSRPAEADRPWCAALVELGQITCKKLAELGNETAVALEPAEGRDTLQEAIAARAGIAWVGKCAYPVTWDFGSAVRLLTILTTATLPVDGPVQTSFCGTCRMCTDNCPTNAVKGELWEDHKSFGDLVDVEACEQRAYDLASQGESCRACMAVCPFTSVYLSNCGHDTE